MEMVFLLLFLMNIMKDCFFFISFLFLDEYYEILFFLVVDIGYQVCCCGALLYNFFSFNFSVSYGFS
ncbi:hypothetical protein QBC38DRAFT_480449 [Podospora fimiseda]|uniref:Uncharacterized protein n=1 Tax=Podospora fimiseda TaxID=252190 RepID=A0AAN7BN80_9PEZI|nr:hypothetical protein QBC38DRAFT_480449 [Podospora fimiseda]